MAEDISSRLRLALELRGMSQKELADRIGTSEASISQWLSGKKEPSRESAKDAAQELGVFPSWLVFGEGNPPQPDFTAAREKYSALAWVFRREPADHGRDYGNPNMWSLPWDIRTLVREALQNVDDVIVDVDQGADVEFRIIRLTGTDLERFLEAIQWEARKSRPGLRQHLEEAARTGQKLGSILRDGLERLHDEQELILLRVEDRGTRGLLGPEFGTGNFAALARNNLDSSKQANTAGGSYGLGKAVFTRASRFATVLFHSNLSQPQRLNSQEYREGRLFGRSDLAWHEIDGINYAGPGWFGLVEAAEEGERAVSVWQNEALIHDLYLDRPSDSGKAPTGTSILVVGFHDPSADESKDIYTLAQEIAQEVADNFWPALYASRLRVTVTAYDGREMQAQYRVDAEEYQPEYVEMLRRFERGELAEDLSSEGSVVLRHVQLKIPERIVNSDPHHEIVHYATLLVSHASEDSPGRHVDEVAFYRSPLMVVRYHSYRRLVLGGVPFRAVVMAGQAAGNDESAKAAELFLRTAEPPAHDKWMLTPDLKVDYKLGAGTRLNEFLDEVRAKIAELITPQHRDLDDGPRAIKELLRIAGTGEPPAAPKAPKLYVDQENTFVNGKGQWQVQATIRVPNNMTWYVTPALVFAAESRGGRAVKWAELKALENCHLEDNYLVIKAGAREAKFQGISDPESHPVPADEAAISVTLRHPRQVDEGETS